MAQFKWLAATPTIQNMTKTGGQTDYITATDDDLATYWTVSTSTNGSLQNYAGSIVKPNYDLEAQINLYVRGKYGNSSYRTITFKIYTIVDGTPTETFTKTITTTLASTTTVYSIALTGSDLTNFNANFNSQSFFMLQFTFPRYSVIYDAYLLFEEPKISVGLEMGCNF